MPNSAMLRVKCIHELTHVSTWISVWAPSRSSHTNDPFRKPKHAVGKVCVRKQAMLRVSKDAIVHEDY